jgi:hypothetical protein
MITCPQCGTGEWDFTSPGTARCANGHEWAQAPACPGTFVRPGHPGDTNDPERYPEDDDHDADDPRPSDISYDEDSPWCQWHGHTGLLVGSGCTVCDHLVTTDPRFAAALAVHNPDGTRRRERTLVIDVPARILIHLDPATRKAVRVAILPSESDAGYFGPKTELAYVLDGDGEQTPATPAEQQMAAQVWDTDAGWDWAVLPSGPEVEWVV